MHSSATVHVMSVSNEITELFRDACSAIREFSWSRICSGVNLGNFPFNSFAKGGRETVA
jgi:hypothetical protein